MSPRSMHAATHGYHTATGQQGPRSPEQERRDSHVSKSARLEGKPLQGYCGGGGMPSKIEEEEGEDPD